MTDKKTTMSLDEIDMAAENTDLGDYSAKAVFSHLKAYLNTLSDAKLFHKLAGDYNQFIEEFNSLVDAECQKIVSNL